MLDHTYEQHSTDNTPPSAVTIELDPISAAVTDKSRENKRNNK
ncbi:hypothetical protein [Photorhabdus tasmaniensis]|nr:hypothetical protein [Photorhabdus tasmaniensis]